MRLGPFAFSPSPIPTLVALGFFILLCTLGSWQLSRAAEKTNMQVGFAATRDAQPIDETELHRLLRTSLPASVVFKQVRLSGDLFSERQFLLDNRTHNGRAGYHVFTPLLLSNEELILLNRGWVAAPADRSQLPQLDEPPKGDVSIRGRVALARETTFVLGDTGYSDTTWPRIVQRLELTAIADALDQDVLPVVVNLAADDPASSFVRDWKPHIGIGPERHRGYAFQWFALALTLFVIYIVTTVKRVPTEEAST